MLFLTLKTFSATGGIEKFNRSFAKALEENAAENNFNILVYSAYDQQPDERYLAAARFRGFAGNKTRFAAAVLAAARKADLIIASHINLSSLLETLRLLFPGKKRVLMAHGIEVWRPLSGIQQKALLHAQLVCCVSRFTQNLLIREKGLTKNASCIFHNTIDPFFRLASPQAVQDIRTKYGIQDHEKLILTVSRLSATEKRKGYDAVLKAMPGLLKTLPNTKYLLLGKADAAESGRLAQLTEELALHDSVILAGYIADDELPAYYQAADLFAMPSSKEGFGIVFIEAAFAGLDLLAGNQDGSTDALLDGALGTLVDPGDQGAIETAIARSLESPLSAAEKLERRQLVQEHFGFEAFKKRQLGLLRELTDNG